ncbi:MAG: cohesin domain-containing protein [Deltaproteobacteria bacterium]|nr:cohesin domain-containing protein [Deltaproteobacteria bacterium]
MKIIMHIKTMLIMVFLPCLLISCGGGGGGNPVAPGGGGVGQAVTVSNNNPAPGSTFTVTIAVQNEVDLEGATYELSYNHSVIEVDYVFDVSEGVASGGALAGSVVEFAGGTNNLLVSFFKNPPDTGSTFTGSGTMCVITFEAVGSGSTTISFSNIDTEYYYGDGSSRIPLLLSQSITVP